MTAAVTSAVAVAERLGVPVRDPAVLRESSSVIVLLAPGGPVARVAGLTAAVRDNRAHRTREVAVARALAAAGAPVVAPFAPAGPHEHDGRLITLWALAPGGLAEDGAAIGATLRACHAALRAYGGPLPPLRRLLDEAASVLARGALGRADAALVRDGLAAASEAIEAFAAPAQPLHGDAGLGNALAGPLWNDWEDTSLGPVGWDAACLIAGSHGEAAQQAAYAAAGLRLDPGELSLWVEARRLQVEVWRAFLSS